MSKITVKSYCTRVALIQSLAPLRTRGSWTQKQETQREGSPGKREAEMGAMWARALGVTKSPERPGRVPQRLQREQGPTDTSILDLRPPEVREDKFLLF